MYTDLFSSLDGNFSKWIWAVPPVVILSFTFPKSFLSHPIGAAKKNLASLWLGTSKLNLSQAILTQVMFMLILMNLSGLLPYVYGVTTNIWLNSSLALLIWGGTLSSGVFFNPISAIAHLVPSGSPLILIPFLVLIETISILIRPLTLTVRLVANISAGHIVMTLISNILSPLSLNLTFFSIYFLSLGYMLFEMFVSVIQAYIFTLLVSLYMKEHP
uniref:ATP synthase F0 subunit 6 n=1 Tax=Arion flagellus TaxID=236857 RepID=UPI00240F8A81|nr:ATP synthase F0 subunit 6 [Arion flagellus]WES82239.1 ATP synthase F0 subunit 6 [Arion flagellus]